MNPLKSGMMIVDINRSIDWEVLVPCDPYVPEGLNNSVSLTYRSFIGSIYLGSIFVKAMSNNHRMIFIHPSGRIVWLPYDWLPAKDFVYSW